MAIMAFVGSSINVSSNTILNHLLTLHLYSYAYISANAADKISICTSE